MNLTMYREELDVMFGGHLRVDVGQCFKTPDGHFFKQKSTCVIHVFEELINSTHNSILDNDELIEISEDEFDLKMKETIFDLELYKYL